MTGQSWDSSQICVTHSPVVTRKAYCPQGARGQPVEDGGGREGPGGSGWPSWSCCSRRTGRRHPTTCLPPPVASVTLGLSIQEESSGSLAPRPLAVAPWGGGPFLAPHTRYSCLLTHVSAGRAGWQGGLSPERDSDSGSPPGRHRAGMGPPGYGLGGAGWGWGVSA